MEYMCKQCLADQAVFGLRSVPARGRSTPVHLHPSLHLPLPHPWSLGHPQPSPPHPSPSPSSPTLFTFQPNPYEEAVWLGKPGPTKSDIFFHFCQTGPVWNGGGCQPLFGKSKKITRFSGLRLPWGVLQNPWTNFAKYYIFIKGEWTESKDCILNTS